MTDKKGNQWAMLTQFDVDYPYIDVRSYADEYAVPIRGAGQIRFEGIAPATPEILRAMQRWMYRDEPRFPIYQEEWMCLYCGSPNPLPDRHCSQCGAPRNWLIG